MIPNQLIDVFMITSTRIISCVQYTDWTNNTHKYFLTKTDFICLMSCLSTKYNTLYSKCPIKLYLGLLTVLSFSLSAAMVDLSVDVCVCQVVFVAWKFEQTKKRLNEYEVSFRYFLFHNLVWKKRHRMRGWNTYWNK